jgi:hypothetical protein
MKKQRLEYESMTGRENPAPRVRFQTIVSCALLGVALLCAVLAMAWTHRRSELFAAAISLGAGAAIVHAPYWRI